MSRFAPLKLSSMALLGLGLAVGGTAGSADAREMEESFKCPAGTYPDLKQEMPNCEALSPQGQPGPVSLIAPDAQREKLPRTHGAKWRVSWKCPEGSSPNPNASMPNCLNQFGGGAAYSERMQELDRREQELTQREQQLYEQGGQFDEEAFAQREQELEQREQELQQREQALAQREQEGLGGEVTPALENMVTFKVSSAELDQPAKTTLNRVAESLKSEENVASIVIEGRADSTGTTEINQALSQQRADAVRSYLEERGLDVAQIEVRPLGDASPVASNATQSGRQLNRSAAVIAVK